MTCLLMLLFSVAGVQAAKKDIVSDQTHKCIISYVEETHLMKKGNEITVVSLLLEWPEVLCYYSMPRLQKFLCQNVFGNECSSLQEGKKAFLSKMGEEIQTMPDDKGLKVKYISATLMQVYHEPGRFMSFRIVVPKRDGKQVFAELAENILFTYDIAHDEILMTKDMIVRSFQKSGSNNDLMIMMMEKHMPDIGMMIDGNNLPDYACLMGYKGGMAFNLKGSADSNSFESFTVVPMKEVGMALTKKVKKLLASPNVVRKPAVKEGEDKKTTYTDANGELIYTGVDNIPTFKGGSEKLVQYIQQQLVYPDMETNLHIDGRVVVAFVVDKEGRIRDPQVVTPVSSGLDREAVRLIMGMPQWNPGTQQGVPVNVRISLPVHFKLKK